MKIEELDKDLQDGVYLFSLLEILSGETIKPKVNKKARIKVQKIENLNFSFKFLREKQIKLVNISAEDIFEQKKKLILGLIWTLILRFQIQQVEAEDDGKNSVKKDLLDWCNRALNPQGVYVKNFKDDWQDAAAFSGLVNYCRGEPDIDLAALDKESHAGKEKGLSTSFDKAEEYFGFPQLLDAEDLLEEPDELSVMTYVSYFRGYKTENTACAALSVAYGPGLKTAKTHREAGYTVELKNDEGERVRVGGTSVTGTMVLGDDRYKVQVKDNKDGTYACTYEVPKAGTYELVVLCEGQHIKDSPFSPVVEPSEALADECTANPESPVVAGELAEFVVQTRDASGNPKPDGGEQISAKLGSELSADVKDNEDGTYAVSYTPEKAGEFKLAVLLKDDNIKASPFAVTVKPANPDASKSTAAGAGVSTANTDAPAQFVVTTRDRFNNECIEGGAKLTSSLAGTGDVDGQKLAVDITDNNDGTYTAQYQATKAGAYTLNVALAGANIKDAPFTVTVAPGAATAGNTVASGDGLSKVVAGETGEFRVQTRDANNNALAAGGDSIAGALSGAASDVKVQVKDNGDGSYAGSYVPTVAGDYKLDVTHNSASIQDAPFSVQVVPAAPNAPKSEAAGAGIAAANTDEPATFVVQTKDEFGNKCVEGGADITVAAKGGNSDEVAKGTVKDNGDGTYAVDYQPTGAGDFSLEVKLAGEHIKDSPFSVKVAPGAATAGNTVAEGDGLRTVVAGETGAFKVTTKDSNGNQLSEGGNDINATFKGADGNSADVKVTDNNDGTYDAAYVPKVVGEYTLAVNLASDAIKDSPFAVQVTPAGPNAGNTEASGAGIAAANTDEPAKFSIQAKDAFGNNCNTGGAPITVQAVADGSTVDGKVTDNGDGTYDVEYEPKSAGDFTLQVKLDGENIKDAPFTVKVDPGAATAGNTVAEGEGLRTVVAGETGTFKVTTKDENGNQLSVGGNKISGALSGTDDVTVDVKDNNDGTYDASYVAQKVGDYSLAVKLDADNIKDSPFSVAVVPAGPNAARSEASGAGIATANTDEPATFSIQTKDEFGNNCADGGADIKVVARGPNDETVQGNVKDNGDGTYAVDYQPKGSGEFTLDVTLGGDNIKDAPFTVKVDPGAATAGNTVVDGDGLRTVVAGETGEFTVTTKDNNGNQLAVGGNTVSGKLSGPSDASVDVKDNGDGTYAGSYVPKTVGEHTLSVALNGDDVASSPFTVQVTPAAPHAGNTEASGAGIATANTDEPATFAIQTKDEFGNKCVEGGADIKVVARGPNSESVDGNVTDNGDGTYAVDYQPKGSGDFTLDVTLGGANIKDAPFSVKVEPGKAVAGNSVAEGDGLRTVVAGETGKFTVTTKDNNGNQLTRGGNKVAAALSGPDSVKASVSDNDNGTYDAEYVPTKTGEYSLDVTVDGDSIDSAPFTVQVTPAAAVAPETFAWGSGLESSTSGVQGVFMVQTKDRFGNRCVKGGDAVTASISGPAGEQTCGVKDYGSGQYLLDYMGPEQGGEYKISVKLDGDDIKDSPVSVTVAPSPVSAANCTVSGDGLKRVVAGEEGKFEVVLHDKFGNAVRQGGVTVRSYLAGPRAIRAVVADNSDGTYNGSYTPEKAGDYKLTVTVGGEELPDSPYAVEVVPAAADGSRSWASGNGLFKARVATPGKEGTFSVSAHDRFGNKCREGGAPLTGVLVGGTKNETIQVEVQDKGDGTYECGYDLEHRGEYQLTVKIGAEHVHHSPYTVIAKPGATAAQKTEFMGEQSRGVAGKSAFQVQLNDKLGNARHKGGDDVQVRFERPTATLSKAKDKGDGTFDIVVPPELDGDYKVYVMVDGEELEVGDMHVEHEQLKADEEAELRRRMPGASDALIRMLNNATPEERAAVLGDLRTGMLPADELAVIREKEEAERAAAREAEAKAKAEAKAARAAAKQKILDDAAAELAGLQAEEEAAFEKAANELTALQAEIDDANRAERERLQAEFDETEKRRMAELDEYRKKLEAAEAVVEVERKATTQAKEEAVEAEVKAEIAEQVAEKEAADVVEAVATAEKNIAAVTKDKAAAVKEEAVTVAKEAKKAATEESSKSSKKSSKSSKKDKSSKKSSKKDSVVLSPRSSSKRSSSSSSKKTDDVVSPRKSTSSKSSGSKVSKKSKKSTLKKEKK